jgi:alpha-beta hydrolase superfamily lysophospholipase
VFPVLRHLAGLVGRWLPRLRLVQVSFQSLSRDPAVVAEFQADPLVFHGRFPVRTGAEILRAMRRLEAAAGSLQLPLLVLQGTADRLCDPDGSREFYRLAGSADKTLRLYDGLYHDIFHEPEHEQVLADLVAWLDARR